MKTTVIILFSVLSVGHRYANATEGSCITSTDTTGTCQLINNCDQLSGVLKKLSFPEFVRLYGGCGSDIDGNTRICCPVDTVRVGLSCDPPAEFLEGLGCVRPVAEEMTWLEARDNCRNLGGNVITGLQTEMHLRQLRTHFIRVFHLSNKPHVWVGVQGGVYIGGKGEKPPGYYWFPGHPKEGGSECAFVDLQDETPSLGEAVCSEKKLPSFCFFQVY
ncbi:uncharacterized protein [Macrobrachium rosenbergii]|uniref:uncharacterized protein n=1 Tax=Macrobrachium rosenbergii TaxID=79674 RepID=UPI0034D51D77